MARLLSWVLSRLLDLLHLAHKEKALPQHVTDAVTCNIHHSFLHRLPLDVLYYLTTNHIADPADLLALRAATRALRFSPIIHAPPPHRRASRTFLYRLRLDAFARACAAEHHERALQQQHQQQNRYPARPLHHLLPTILRPPRHAICSACLTPHPHAHFTPTQLARAPERRLCRSTDGAVRLCPHVAYTFTELRRLRARPPRTERDGYTLVRRCWQCAPRVPRRRRRRRGWEPEPGEAGARLVGVAVGWVGRDGWHWKREFYVAERSMVAVGEGEGVVVVGAGGGGEGVVVERWTRFTRELVFSVLKAVVERRREDVFVCAHVRLDDPATFDTRLVEDFSAISEHTCRARQGCHVRVCLKWDVISRPRPYVELQINRFFDVESLNKKQWLNQIQRLAEE